MTGDQDLLERATRALRETSSPSPQELAEGKAVLMWAQRAAQKKKRNRTMRWVLPLAAVLFAGSALAASEQAQRMARAVVALITPGEESPRPRAPKRPPAPKLEPAARTDAPTPPVSPEAVAEVGPDAAAAPASVDASASVPHEPAHADRAPARRPRAEPEPVSAPKLAPAEPPELPEPPTSAEPPSSADLARYREAHQLHFRARDFSGALAAWDLYLHEFPQGTFVIEARYNRAICLVRLGRTDQARYALSPFARGEIGRGYRQAEATKLLEALE